MRVISDPKLPLKTAACNDVSPSLAGSVTCKLMSVDAPFWMSKSTMVSCPKEHPK